jgi:hypothetical protein
VRRPRARGRAVYAPTTLLTVGDAGPGPPSFIGTT